MPITTGFNHVATLTTDMDRTVAFYTDAFDAVKVFEIEQWSLFFRDPDGMELEVCASAE